MASDARSFSVSFTEHEVIDALVQTYPHLFTRSTTVKSGRLIASHSLLTGQLTEGQDMVVAMELQDEEPF